MTDTDIRVQLAKKLGWRYPVGNPTELPSLYDLCQEGEERLTKEQQQATYCFLLFDNDDLIYSEDAFPHIRLSNLPGRARALCEVL